jgi:endonuclease I
MVVAVALAAAVVIGGNRIKLILIKKADCSAFFCTFAASTNSSMTMNNKTKCFCLSWLLLFVTVAAQAQGPNNSGTYYANANGKSGSALKTALSGIISKRSDVGYDGLYEAYKKTDTRADGYVRDWYSNATKYVHGKDNKGSYSGEGDMYNREHSVPQSWGPPKSDIVHVLPTDGYVNNRRSNYPLAEVGSTTYQSKNGYSKLGSCKTAGYSGTVFEPNDEIKGDMARIYFYMVTCYESSATGWGHSVFSSSKYPGFEKWYLDMLMRWSKQDPVDAVEIARNNAVYEVQNNRNPFVDYPGLEEYVWGTKKTQAFNYSSYEDPTGGSGGAVTTVAPPVFSPEGGNYTDKVVVSMTTTTEDATIYYTTDNSDATVDSKLYTGPITLTSTTTLKAIAVCEGDISYQTTAAYTITDSQGLAEPEEGLIAFGNELFGTNFKGTISGNNMADFTGTKNGVTFIYGKGTGSNQYIADDQIRLYQKNTLKVSTSQGTLTELEFVLAPETSKKLIASTGTVTGLTWTGNASSVTFNVNDGSGNMQLSGVKVKKTSTSGLHQVSVKEQQKNEVFTLSGQRLRVGASAGMRIDRAAMKPGIYILNGKKVVVK